MKLVHKLFGKYSVYTSLDQPEGQIKFTYEPHQLQSKAEEIKEKIRGGQVYGVEIDNDALKTNDPAIDAIIVAAYFRGFSDGRPDLFVSIPPLRPEPDEKPTKPPAPPKPNVTKV